MKLRINFSHEAAVVCQCRSDSETKRLFKNLTAELRNPHLHSVELLDPKDKAIAKGEAGEIKVTDHGKKQGWTPNELTQ